MPRHMLCGFFALASSLAVVGSADAAPVGPSQAELDRAAVATDSWLMTNKSYDGHRFVALDQINAGNVGGLKDVCVYDTGLAAPAQSSPVLYQGRIYFTAAQTTVAIDARSCKEIWRHDWRLKGKALSIVNRGAVIKDGKLVRGTADGFLIAISMEDGKLLWEKQITSIEESHYLSMPPVIVDDLIVYGTAGADWGGHGWIGAFRLEDGTRVWKYDALPRPTAQRRKAGDRRRLLPMAAAASGLRFRSTEPRACCSRRSAIRRPIFMAKRGPATMRARIQRRRST